MVRAKTVSSYFARQALRQAERRHAMSRHEFLTRTGIVAAELEVGARVPWAKHVKVVEICVALDQAPTADVPGGRFWEPLGVEFPLLVSAWLNAPTARQAVTSYLAYRSVMGESDFVRVRETDEALQLEYLAEGPQHLASWQARGNFYSLLSVLRAYPATANVRGRIQLAGPSSRARVRVDLADVSYGAGACTLELPRRALEAPNPTYNPPVAEIAARHLSAQLAELRREGGLSLRVERLLRRTLGPTPRGAAGDAQALERICSELGMTRAALRRELAREGTSFKALSAGVKLVEAQRLLEESHYTMAEIGDHLGFLQQSAFTHFFRRGTGVAPLRYRQARRAG